jgi:hypothetical protein
MRLYYPFRNYHTITFYVVPMDVFLLLWGFSCELVPAFLSLCLIKHQAMKTYWGVEVQNHAFLTSALGGVISLTPLAALPPVPIWYDAGWAQSRCGWEGEEKNSKPPPPGFEPWSSNPWSATIPTEISRLLYHWKYITTLDEILCWRFTLKSVRKN